MSAGSKFAGIVLVLAIITGMAACGSEDSPSVGTLTGTGISAKDLENYDFDSSAPLIDRVKDAPDFVLTHLEDVMDATQSYTPYIPTEEEAVEIETYLDLLPRSYWETLWERLIGIYFINNWTGSGAADYVFDSDNEVYSYIIVNPETMWHDASEWISYREETCFIWDDEEDSAITVTVDCGHEYTCLMLLFIHEASHIMDYVHHYTPYVMEELVQSFSETDFVRGVWADFEVPEEDADFSLRESITFYGKNNGPLIHATQAPDLYRELEGTPFASVYGSQDWAEDFAEYCMWRYFTTELGQPYRIIVARDGITEIEYEPMESNLVQERTGIPDL